MTKSPHDLAMLLEYLVSPEAIPTQETYVRVVTELGKATGMATLSPNNGHFPARFLWPVEEATLQIV